MSLQRMAAEDRRWAADRRAMEELEDRQPVRGTHRYQVDAEDIRIGEILDAAVRKQGGYCVLTPWQVNELANKVRTEVQGRAARLSTERNPGWRVPPGAASSWPIYQTEAVTFDTEWGAVTVGRSLARIYDIDGWPDAATLETMAQQQAAREGVPA